MTVRVRPAGRGPGEAKETQMQAHDLTPPLTTQTETAPHTWAPTWAEDPEVFEAMSWTRRTIVKLCSSNRRLEAQHLTVLVTKAEGALPVPAPLALLRSAWSAELARITGASWPYLMATPMPETPVPYAEACIAYVATARAKLGAKEGALMSQRLSDARNFLDRLEVEIER